MTRKNTLPLSGGRLAVILCGIVFLPSAIELTIYSFLNTSILVKCSFIVAVLLMILCFAFLENTVAKFVFSALVVVFYAKYFCSSENGLVTHARDAVEAFILCFTLMAPCYFLGSLFGRRVEADRRQKRMQQLERLKAEIRRLREENGGLKQRIKEKEAVRTMIRLLGRCGGEIGEIEKHEAFTGLSSLEDQIRSNNEKLKELEQERGKLVSLLKTEITKKF